MSQQKMKTTPNKALTTGDKHCANPNHYEFNLGRGGAGMCCDRLHEIMMKERDAIVKSLTEELKEQLADAVSDLAQREVYFEERIYNLKLQIQDLEK